MCARTTLTNDDLGEIAEALDAEFSPDDAAIYKPRWNVAPTDVTWIVRFGADRRVLLPAVWGYQVSRGNERGRGRPLINVRGEQVASGGGFRDAFADRRCAVVTDGFYEWPGQGLAPFWFHRPDAGLVLLAGLYQTADGTGEPPRFTVLTTRPNKLVGAVHDRMPVILPVDLTRLDDWLTAPPASAAALIGPAPEEVLVATPVSKRVNSVKNDDPACIAPAQHAPAPTQGSLF